MKMNLFCALTLFLHLDISHSMFFSNAKYSIKYIYIDTQSVKLT